MSYSTLPKLEKIERLSSIVIRILGCNPGPYTLQGTNTYLVGTGKQRFLIDTGEGKPEYTQLLGGILREQNCVISDAFITHYHHDHIGGIKSLKHAIGNFNVWKMKEENPSQQQLESQEEKPEQTTFEDIKPITDGQIFSCEGATLKAISTPGHTPEHVGFFLEEEQTFFSGDCVLGSGTAVFDDLYTYMLSLQKILTNIPNLSKIYPGHGPVVVDGKAKVNEYINHRMTRESQIVSSLKDGKNLLVDDIVKKVYGPLPQTLFFGAKNNVLHHLKKLEIEKKVLIIQQPNNTILYTLSSSASL
eukprot:c15945_g1_i1.p1 GENE.c15945_g1_i1~~c15945_g1_i1.p1  ORF type:complete len:303 (+),score=113.85 c15945_g1_i1:39-947(+)